MEPALGEEEWPLAATGLQRLARLVCELAAEGGPTASTDLRQRAAEAVQQLRNASGEEAVWH